MDIDKMNTNLEANLFNKEGFEFSRVSKNHYRLTFVTNY